MKKLGLSILALCASFVLVGQANAQCGGCYTDQCIDTCKEYRASGTCTVTCPYKKYRAIPYCVTRYYQEPYTVQKQGCNQVAQYYQTTHCKMVPQYYQVTRCRMVPQPYTYNETHYRTRSYQERHVTYQPYIIYKTHTTCAQGEEPVSTGSFNGCGNDCGCGSDCGCPVDCGCAPACGCPAQAPAANNNSCGK